jgi:hypothetical protein
MTTFLTKSGEAPEFPVGRIPANQAIPRVREPDWVDEAELRRLKDYFRGTTPQGREIMRKILFRVRRKLFGFPKK